MSGDAEIGRKRFPNARGQRGVSLELPKGAREISFVISSEDAARRHFLIDAVLSQ